MQSIRGRNWFVVLIVMGSTLACQLGGSRAFEPVQVEAVVEATETVVEAVTETTVEEAITDDENTIEPIDQMVEYDPDGSGLAVLHDIAVLEDGSTVRVTDFGEAELDFGSGQLIRVFNDAELDVEVDVSDQATIFTQLFLKLGLATGQVTEEGSTTEWTTPGGASITISGTEYFVLYIENGNRSFIGNFEGTIEAGDEENPTQAVGEAEILELPAGNTYPLDLTLEEFEGELRATGDPILVVRTLIGELSIDSTTMIMSFAGEPFADDGVRDAILMAAPWRDIVDEVLAADVPIVFEPYGDPAERQSMAGYVFDLDMAREQIEAGGYSTSDDVTMLRFTLYVMEIEGLLVVADVALSYLFDAGVIVDIVPIPVSDWNSFIAASAAAGEEFWALSLFEPFTGTLDSSDFMAPGQLAAPPNQGIDSGSGDN